MKQRSNPYAVIGSCHDAYAHTICILPHILAQPTTCRCSLRGKKNPNRKRKKKAF